MDWKIFYKKLSLLILVFFWIPALAYPTLFVEPDDSYNPVLQEINSAKQSIDMAMYLLSDQRIIHALIDAKRRGVRVRVILEKNIYGGSDKPARTQRQLENAGIQIKWSNPAFFSLMHEKSFSVDHKRLVIMTLNQTYSAYHFNREYGVIDEDTSNISEFTNVFNSDWENTPQNTTVENLIWAPNNASHRLLQFIQSTSQTLYVEAEELNNKAIENALIKAAQRGVDVRIILPPQKYYYSIDRILRRGVHLRILSKHFLYMHAKLMIADNKKIFIGSENLSRYSLEMNRELGIVVYYPRFLQRLAPLFETDWKKASPVYY